MNTRWVPMSVLAAVVALVCGLGAARADQAPTGAPDVAVDLTTTSGAGLVRGTWRYHDTRITDVAFRSVGPDRKPSGPPDQTYDFDPHAGAADFDDSRWEVVRPEALADRRSTGRFCFAWYRIRITVPDRIGDFDPTGSTAVFEITVDDYAEVWVDGKLPRELGQSGGSLIRGWNAPNRLVIGRGVRPGQVIQLAVFAINGPLSDPPPNYIWVRSARLDFYRPLAATARLAGSPLRVTRVTAGLDEVVPSGATVERLADGFAFTEGPVWAPEGYLLFSDPNANVIYRWAPDGEVAVARERSGLDGDISEYHQPGSNGLTFDPEGRLTICQHGNRRVIRLEPDGTETVLADRYEGKRLNSPNDLVYRSDGALYFTDPPFGLPRVYDDPRKELPYSGVFCLAGGKLRLVSTDLKGPNGLAFSPDEKFLYVDDWDEAKKIVMRYEVRPDGSLANGTVFFDMGSAPEPEALDGLKVDRRGNLYVSGPGGLWILSPAGKHLGTIQAPELPANFAWGDADGRTLYLTARTGLYRVRLKIAGIRPMPSAGTRTSLRSN